MLLLQLPFSLSVSNLTTFSGSLFFRLCFVLLISVMLVCLISYVFQVTPKVLKKRMTPSSSGFSLLLAFIFTIPFFLLMMASFLFLHQSNQLSALPSVISGFFVGLLLIRSTLILGLVALVRPIKVYKQTQKTKLFILLVLQFVISFLALKNIPPVILGVLLLLIISVFSVVYLRRTPIIFHDLFQKKLISKKNLLDSRIWKTFIIVTLILFGIFTVFYLGRFGIAEGYEVNRLNLYILSLVAAVPEIIFYLKDLRNYQDDLIVSTVPISNVLSIGVLASMLILFSPSVVLDRNLVQFELPFLLLVQVIMILFLMTRKKLDRKESIILWLLAAIFISLKILGF